MSGDTPLDGARQSWEARLATHGLQALGEIARASPLHPGVGRFVFLRHGQTEGNRLRIFQAAETPLNEAGREQAVSAAGLLAGVRLGRVFASDMRRAWETASIVSQRVAAELIPEPLLRERWFGDLVGTSSADLDWQMEPPGGETLRSFIGRTQKGFEIALAGGNGTANDPTLVVAHGGSLYVLAFSLGVKLDADMTSNAAPIIFERCGDAWLARLLQKGTQNGSALPSGMGW